MTKPQSIKLSRIYWWNPVTMAGGHGEPIPDDLANAWLHHVNAKYPSLEHSVMGEKPLDGPRGSHSRP